MQIISNKIDSENVYLLIQRKVNILNYIQLCKQVKINLLLETFRKFLLSVRFTRGSQEALLVKIGISINTINQNGRKITVKELLFWYVTNSVPVT